MSIKQLSCPSCGSPLGKYRKPNEMFACRFCDATLVVTDWKIDQLDGTAVTVITDRGRYTIADLLAKGDLCNLYLCGFKAGGQDWQAVFKIARDTADNDLVQNEARILRSLQGAEGFREFNPFLPKLLESFIYQDSESANPRQVNILTLHEQIASPMELYSLEDVRNHHITGIHPKDMAWMWRRVLSVLGFAHNGGIIHGAVLPAHILIEPKDHKLALIDWSYAVRNPQKSGERIKAISTAYEKWYGPEVFAKEQPTPGLDIHMAAKSMIYLLGIDPTTNAVPSGLEPDLQNIFGRCLEPDPRRRPQNAWELLETYDKIIERLWGPRQFREFTMPPKE